MKEIPCLGQVESDFACAVRTERVPQALSQACIVPNLIGGVCCLADQDVYLEDHSRQDPMISLLRWSSSRWELLRVERAATL